MKMKAIATSLALALSSGSSAMAQDRMTDAQCGASLDVVAQMMGVPDMGLDFRADDQGWCLINEAAFSVSGQQQLKIASLRWRATDIARFIDDGLPPRVFEVEGKGFGMSVETGDPVFDYLFGLQSSVANSGFGLSIRWDGVQSTVHIDTAYIDFFADNRVEATGLIDGVDLTDMATIETSLGTMGLRDLTVESDMNGWFEAYVAMPLGMAILDQDGDVPNVQVMALQQQAIDVVDKLPDIIVPPASRNALGAFITDLPSPRGKAQLQLSADPSLGMMRFAPFALMSQEPTIDQIVELGLNNVALLFTWTPQGDNE